MSDKNKNYESKNNLEEIDFDLDSLDSFTDGQLTSAGQGSAAQTAVDEDKNTSQKAKREKNFLDTKLAVGNDFNSADIETGGNSGDSFSEEDEAKEAGSVLPGQDNQDVDLEQKQDEQVKEKLAEQQPVDSGGQTESGQEDFSEDKTLVLPFSKVKIIKKLLANIRENSRQLESLLAGLDVQDDYRLRLSQMEISEAEPSVGRERIVEGVFDGENMIGPDGKQYTVPANYASKSKLVEGDMMKLTITANGTFLYKQIGPVERKRLVGTLDKDANGNYIAVVEGRKWRVLTASVTYFRGEVGDEIVILVPRAGGSRWAAVENIVKKT